MAMVLECKLLLPQQQCDSSVIVAGEAESAVLCVSMMFIRLCSDPAALEKVQ